MSRHLVNLTQGIIRGSPYILTRCTACMAKDSLMKQQTRALRLYKERTVRLMYWRGRSFDAMKYAERRRSEFQDWNYRSEIFAFSRRLQENLSEDTLRKVFAHQSYIDSLQRNQARYDLPSLKIASNGELVTRGVELLDDSIKPYLRHQFTHMPEDGIVSMNDYLQSDKVLADVAKWFGCKEIVLTAEWPPSELTMANTVRALIAGIEADLGVERVRRFVVDMIISYLNDKDILDDVWHIPNPRETLNLILKNSQLPAYEPRIMFQTGVRTLEPCHIVGLYVNHKFLGSNAGETLSIAEDCAALDALQRLFDLKEDRAPYIYGEASENIDYDAHTKEHAYVRTWQFKLE